MIIKDVTFSGFKSKDEKTGLDLNLTKNQSVLVARSENKNFLFESLLGIIFGFSESEKIAFRDPEAQVYTGRASMQFDNYILHIERDFETNIIAVLSEGKKKKWIYQGRDVVDGPMVRPYLDFLETYFSIQDKSILLTLYKKLYNNPKSTFAETLDLLYLFLRPKLKLRAIRNLISSCTDVIEHGQDNGRLYRNGLQEALNKLHLMKSYKKITESRISLQRDILQFEKYWDMINNNYVDVHYEKLKQRFPLIHHLNARELKKDITLLHALSGRYQKFQNNLQLIDSKIEQLKEILYKKMVMYANLPNTFVEDFENYLELSTEIEEIRLQYDKLVIQIGEKQNQINRIKRSELSAYLVSFLAIVVLLFLFPENRLMVGILSSCGILLEAVLYNLSKKNWADKINTDHRKLEQLKKKIQLMDKRISKLREESYLIDDTDYIDSHISNFKKYKKMESQLGLLKREKEILLQKSKSEKFTKTLPELEKKYQNLINLNLPEGLQAYIEEFADLQNTAIEKSSGKIDENNLNPLIDIISEYRSVNKKLINTQTYIEQFLNEDIIENNIDTKISQLERTINHLQTQIRTEMSSN